MFVEKIMSRRVDTVAREEKLSHVAELMRERRRRYLPVVEPAPGGERIVGLVTHEEVERATPSAITTLSVGEVNYLISKVTAEKIMVADVVTCGPEMLVEEAGWLMRRKRIGCLPVVSNGVLVGIVTRDDIFDFFLDISGCGGERNSRIAVHLPDRAGALSGLLKTINEVGGYIATVISPQSPDDTGMRIAVVRYRHDDPESVDRHLAANGFDLLSDTPPEAIEAMEAPDANPVALSATTPLIDEQGEAPSPERIARWMSDHDHFARGLGMQVRSVEAGRAVVTMKVRRDMLNAVGMTHGGVTFGLADFAFALASNSHGTTAVGLSASISYPAASREGERLTAEAREENKGGRTGLYTVEVRSADQILVGLFHGTVYRRSDSLNQWMG